MRTSPYVFLWPLLFGLAHTQAPLFYSNQNQYFLHGLAWGGHGQLEHDWLANTADPTPIFSFLIGATYRFLDLSLVHVYYLGCLALYAFAAWKLFLLLCDDKPEPLPGLCFVILFTLMHSGLLRLLSVQIFQKDYPWFFQAGVANQYILGPGLQPSVAGILLVASLVAFVRKRPWMAVALLSFAATLHSTYLLPAAMLTVAYMVIFWGDRGPRQALLLGLLAFTLVLPTVVYNWLTFGPSSASAFARAQEILAHVRIPHHAEIGRWLDWIAWAQIAWIGLAIVLLRGSRLGWILLIVSVQSVLLTLLQSMTNNDTLALLFPWRVSSVLVPVATTIVLTRLVQSLSPTIGRFTPVRLQALEIGGIILLVALAISGLAIPWFGLAYRMTDEERPLLEYVKAHAQAGDVYLIPVKRPTSGGNGSSSASFLPPPRIDKQSEFISVDLQRFRPLAGAPLFVDFKAIPYKDEEVLEWLRRFELCESWYRNPDDAKLAGITHVITSARRPLTGPAFHPIYADEHYILYRLTTE